jgi:hypothetical protein
VLSQTVFTQLKISLIQVHELISAMATIVQALGTEFQCFAVEEFVVHPDFDISTFQNDIQVCNSWRQ